MSILFSMLLMGLGLAISLFVRRRLQPTTQLLPPVDSLPDPPAAPDSFLGSEASSAAISSGGNPFAPGRTPPSASFLFPPSGGYPLSIMLPTSPPASPPASWPDSLPQQSEEASFSPQIQQTLAAFQFILQAFQRHSPALSGPLHPDFLHDLTLILQQADLASIALDLLDHAENVLFRYRVDFAAPEKCPLQDPARGLELPLFPPSAVASHRILLGPLARFHSYAHRLRFPWRKASDRPLVAPNRFASKYLEFSSAYRLSASVWVSDLARRTGAILQVAPSGAYAFASSNHVHQPVFLHRSECDQSVPFRIGQQVSFVLVHTPRGYQGRNIRPA